MRELLEEYQSKINNWEYEIQSDKIKKREDIPENEIKEMIDFFGVQDEPLSKIYSNLCRLMDSSDITEVLAHLEDSWEVLNKYLKQYK